MTLNYMMSYLDSPLAGVLKERLSLVRTPNPENGKSKRSEISSNIRTCNAVGNKYDGSRRRRMMKKSSNHDSMLGDPPIQLSKKPNTHLFHDS